MDKSRGITALLVMLNLELIDEKLYRLASLQFGPFPGSQGVE
jgi:hypothetical protein